MPARRRGVALRPESPFDWTACTAFLAARATPGVEQVSPDAYRRSVFIDGTAGTIDVRRGRGGALDLRASAPGLAQGAATRVQRMFDLDSDQRAITAHLGQDPLLAPWLSAHPGIRVPGAWDGFELAVRAVLGQQVTVRAATTLAGRIAQAWGTVVPEDRGLSRLFPDAGQLLDAPLERHGVMPARAATIRALARAVLDDAVGFEPGHPRATVEAWRTVPGIGPWTASYIAMRALGDRDAFPSGDLVLRRAAGGLTARALEARAERWRPWRAYAVILLWHGAAANGGPPGARR